LNDKESVKLCDIAEIVMGQSPKGDTCNTSGTGIPLLNGPTEFGSHHPTPVQFTIDAKKFAQKGGLLFCVRGSTTGRMNWANQKYAIGRGIASIHHKSGQEFQPYLRGVIEYILSDLLAQATGSTFPNVSREQLCNQNIPNHSLSTQKKITSFLSSLDDKIELNNRMNETLEAMAQALFKSWFVDFDPVCAKMAGRAPEGMDAETAALFPDEMEVVDGREVPKGWRVGKIGDIAKITDCLHSKKPDRIASGRPLLQLCNICDDGLIDMSDTYCISEKDYEKWISRIEATSGDCVITNVGRVGAVAQIPEGHKAALGRNMTAIRCNTDHYYPTFLIELLLSDYMRSVIDSKTDSGTILSALNVRNIPKLTVILPSEDLVQQFENIS